jgi:hypothetical protein
MKPITQTKFWQLPAALKLVVTWFFLLGLFSFWKAGSLYIETGYSIGTGNLIRGIIELGLAIGLINRSNESREWAAFFVLLGIFAGLFLLAVTVFEDPNSVGGFQFSYNQLTRTQAIVFLVAYVALNAGVLSVLLRPETKAFFSPQTSQVGNQ